ncbi:hypothetical protein LINPERPRIM_LOCUS35784, partial [Linum perenne]
NPSSSSTPTTSRRPPTHLTTAANCPLCRTARTRSTWIASTSGLDLTPTAPSAAPESSSRRRRCSSRSWRHESVPASSRIRTSSSRIWNSSLPDLILEDKKFKSLSR